MPWAYHDGLMKAHSVGHLSAFGFGLGQYGMHEVILIDCVIYNTKFLSPFIWGGVNQT